MLGPNRELGFDYDLQSTVGIDLSRNSLRGEIPEGLFGLKGLEYLNLSYNFLAGEIPGSFEKMGSLRGLDLSHNSLSGEIPASLSGLRELEFLNLSYNSLSGSVPEKKGLWRFPGAFAGNPGLCVEGCERAGVSPAGFGREDGEEEGGFVSEWAFLASGLVSFYVSVVVLFCTAPAKNYILGPSKIEP
eukprot:TRINITY_DN13814_c0_g1_i1.p1 TRINITY_DN13814_c0_g1~~TRINITY_DN13814_c0_g1_i1.p1  ORF type:complete len:188 (+),score=24.99 TRINITY_DN13814_c0_g1_i1:738-1301(+)